MPLVAWTPTNQIAALALDHGGNDSYLRRVTAHGPLRSRGDKIPQEGVGGPTPHDRNRPHFAAVHTAALQCTLTLLPH